MDILKTIVLVYFIINITFLIVLIAFGDDKDQTLKRKFSVILIGLPAFIYWSLKNSDDLKREKLKLHFIIAMAILVIILNLIIM